MAGLNWDKINDQKRRLDEKLSKGGGSGAKFWKAKDGENKIRIMPGWATDGVFAGQFWREVAQHWNVSEDQKGPVLCPKGTPHMDQACPICAFVDELKKDKGNVRAQELVKELRAKTCYLLNIVDYKDPVYTAADVAEFKKNRPDSDVPFEVGAPKVQVYPAPSTVFNQILNVIQMNQVDITDRSEGHDMIVKKSGKGLRTRYESTIVLSRSEAPEGESVDLSDIGFTMSSEQMVDLLSQGAGGEFVALLPSVGVGAPEDEAEADDSDDADDLRSSLQAALGS